MRRPSPATAPATPPIITPPPAPPEPAEANPPAPDQPENPSNTGAQVEPDGDDADAVARWLAETLAEAPPVPPTATALIAGVLVRRPPATTPPPPPKGSGRPATGSGGATPPATANISVDQHKPVKVARSGPAARNPETPATRPLEGAAGHYRYPRKGMTGDRR